MMNESQTLIEELTSLDARIRHVAILLDGALETRERVGLEDALSSVDRQEALDTTLADLAQRSRNIGRGSARFVVIRHGHFWQLAMACRGGHVSIGIDLGGDPLEIAAMAADVLLARGR